MDRKLYLDENSKVLCIYHRVDNDGYASGGIIRYFCELNNCENVIMLGKNYYDNFDDIIELLRSDKNEIITIMADFSLSLDLMLEIKKLSKQFIWLDHHDTAIQDLKNETFEGIQDNEKAGCELTWEYLFPNDIMPYFIRMLGRYDVFDQTDEKLWEMDILPMQFGFDITYRNPNSDDGYKIWKIKLDEYFGYERYNMETFIYSDKNIKSNGWAVKKYRNQLNSYNYYNAFETTIKGLKTICINTPIRSSLSFSKILELDNYDILCAYIFNGNEYAVTLFSNNDMIHVGEIAKEFNGGGHQGAAGLRIKNIFKLFDSETKKLK